MSDTPRTDAVYDADLLDRSIKEHGRTWGWGVVSDFRDLCRQLERELNEAQHRIRTLIEERDRARIDAATGTECVKQLRHAMSFVFPRCNYLHHPKKYQHEITEQCPVEELIRKAKDL